MNVMRMMKQVRVLDLGNFHLEHVSLDVLTTISASNYQENLSK